MSAILPMFPLGLVVFPGEPLNLHVFEPRYRQLTHEAQEFGTTFGIPTILDGRLMPIATEVELLEIHKVYPGGEMDIKTMGKRKCSITSFQEKAADRLYGSADVEWIDDDLSSDLAMNSDLMHRIDQLYGLIKTTRIAPIDPTSFLTYEFAHHVGFSTEQEYEFLTLNLETERQAFMLEHLDELIRSLERTEELKRRIQANGHFKNVIPPDFTV